jgi:hypothetical protein
LDANDFRAHFDRVFGSDMGSEIGGDVAIHSHLTGLDEFFDTATGAETGGGEKTIKAHDWRRFGWKERKMQGMS